MLSLDCGCSESCRWNLHTRGLQGSATLFLQPTWQHALFSLVVTSLRTRRDLEEGWGPVPAHLCWQSRRPLQNLRLLLQTVANGCSPGGPCSCTSYTWSNNCSISNLPFVQSIASEDKDGGSSRWGPGTPIEHHKAHLLSKQRVECFLLMLKTAKSPSYVWIHHLSPSLSYSRKLSMHSGCHTNCHPVNTLPFTSYPGLLNLIAAFRMPWQALPAGECHPSQLLSWMLSPWKLILSTLSFFYFIQPLSPWSPAQGLVSTKPWPINILKEHVG